MKILTRLKIGWAFKRDPYLNEVIYVTNQHLVNEILGRLKDDPDYIAFMKKLEESLRDSFRKAIK